MGGEETDGPGGLRRGDEREGKAIESKEKGKAQRE